MYEGGDEKQEILQVYSEILVSFSFFFKVILKLLLNSFRFVTATQRLF